MKTGYLFYNSSSLRKEEGWFENAEPDENFNLQPLADGGGLPSEINR